jgi:hypothetical protein
LKTELAAVTLTQLKPWPQIPSLQNASGIGYYETTVKLTKSARGIRIYLNVGDVEGTYGVRINGMTLNAVDQFGSSPIDVTDYVVDGANSKSHRLSSHDLPQSLTIRN